MTLEEKFKKVAPYLTVINFTIFMFMLFNKDVRSSYKKHKNWIEQKRKEDGYKDHLDGGLADELSPSDFDEDALEKGLNVELEHTNDPDIALEIAMDHLSENADYYTKLAEIEKEK